MSTKEPSLIALVCVLTNQFFGLSGPVYRQRQAQTEAHGLSEFLNYLT